MPGPRILHMLVIACASILSTFSPLFIYILGYVHFTASAKMPTCCLPYFHGFPEDRVAVWFPTMISEYYVSPQLS